MTWKFLRMQPHTRKDGSATALSVRDRACVECGERFEVKAPGAASPDGGGSKAFGRVHCDAHKLTQAETREKWLAAVRAGAENKRAEKAAGKP